MKRLLIVISLFALLALNSAAQGLFRPVDKSIFTLTADKGLKATATPSVWIWRIDATICPQTAFNWDATLKQFVPTSLSSIGPGIGFKHYVPTSATDATPFENFGFSGAVMLGANIYHPDLSKIELAQEVDVLQYIKFGVTETLNTKNWFGFFLGSGITF